MTERPRRLAAAAAAAALLGGCATPQGTVVLLPDPQGRQTAVSVQQDGGTVLLDAPYAAARLSSAGPRKDSVSAQQVQAQFGAALAARPQPPAQFTLFFVDGRDEFTDASRQVIDRLSAEIASRPVPDVLVIGHTDTVGSDAFNDALSRQRAEVVRKALMARGIAAENIVVVGRGKREPALPTGDGVAEPRNRRVEILVR